jgi:glucose/arabinose dehydrogenase
MVSSIELREGKEPVVHEGVFRGLQNPHGLAIDPANGGTMLYIAEEHRIVRVPLYSDGTLEEVAQLPSGGGHYTRTLEFGPDGRLYVSIGSSCNVCEEDDERRAAIYSMNPDGSDFVPFARGLRNSVFFDWSYVDGRMWATEMGRDNLGDDVPPDEINVIEEGKHYGWPYCYGDNIHDARFDASLNAENFCSDEATPSAVNLQAHSAPLGLAFVPEEGWEEEYWYDLLVAFHGSWNRSEPTGYKIVRVQLDEHGEYSGTEDFITGWQSGGRTFGRPVDILAYPGGEAYITDDEAGLIYRLSHTGEVY